MCFSSYAARWPLNKPLADYDLRSGEQALVKSSLFRTNNLRLLCGVKFSSLSSQLISDCDVPDYLLDYLVCRGDHVLLCIHLSNRLNWYGEFYYAPQLPLIELPVESFSQGDVEEILLQLEAILRDNSTPVWQCRLQPSPPELEADLLEEILLETHESGVVPTEYGMFCGLVRVLQPDRQAAMCTAKTARSLPAILASGQGPAFPEHQQIHFEERLKLHRTGLSRSDQASAQLVRDVMEQPLQEYLADFDQELIYVQSFLSEPEATYGDAALLIDELLHSSCDESFSEAVSLMRALAAPMLDDLQLINSLPMAQRVYNRPPDQMPERYHYRKRRPMKAGETKPLADRTHIARLQLPPGALLAISPQEQFFQGVAALTKSAYPRWLSNALRDSYNLSPRWQYAKLLSTANQSLDPDDELSKFRASGIQLLYLLLIQPYCLIIQKTNKEIQTL